MTPFGPGQFASLLLLGIAGLLCAHMLQRHRANTIDTLSRCVQLASVVLLLLGSMGIFWLLLGPFVIIGWAAVIFVVTLVVSRMRRSDERRLIWLLAVAAEQGMPLERTALAYAGQRSGEMALRARRFAELVEKGATLADALKHIRNQPSAGVQMLLTTSSDIKRWGTAVKMEMQSDDTELRREVERAIYLPIVFVLAAAIFLMMVMPLGPARVNVGNSLFSRISHVIGQLDIETTWVSQPFLFTVDIFEQYSGLTLVFGFIVHVLAVLLVAAQLDVAPRNLWIIRRLTALRDSIGVLRVIAATVRDEGPILVSLTKMSQSFPNRLLRKRVARAMTDVEKGNHWCDALASSKLINRSDHGLIMAAERAGNLSWALDAMCDRKLRRLGIRLRLWFNILFPLSLLLLGAAVLLILAGFYLPLMNYVFTVI